MQFSPYQKKVLREKGYCKVNYRKMWAQDRELGYCSKGGLQYDVNIATDAPDPDNVPDIVLLHEIGHIFYGHVDRVDQKKEFQDIEALCNSMNKPFEAINVVYGGPHNFLNICMDLQINTTILTQANVEIMKKNGIGLCVPEAYGIEFEETFRDYYKPLLEQLPDKDEFNQDMQAMKDALEQLKQDIQQKQGNSGTGPGKGMQDLPSDGSMGLDPDLSDELRDAVQKEDYIDGNIKSQKENKVEKDNNGKGTTVNDAVDANDVKNNPTKDEGDQKPVRTHQYGTGEGNSEIVVTKGDPQKEILSFLENIVDSKMEYKYDSLRHYNHGTRRNKDGLMYTSVKRKRQLNNVKLGILIDVSGSMNTEAITKAIQSIDDANIDRQSVVAAWDTGLSQEFLVTKMPNNIRSGGGTDMAGGLKYLVDKGMKEIVIYSDFETNMDNLIDQADIARRKGCKIYSIIAASKGSEERMKNRLDQNETDKVYFNKYCRRNIVVGTN